MSTIDQDVFLFKESLRNNVTLFKKYDDSEVERAFIQSGLEHFIKNIDDENLITEQG